MSSMASWVLGFDLAVIWGQPEVNNCYSQSVVTGLMMLCLSTLSPPDREAALANAGRGDKSGDFPMPRRPCRILPVSRFCTC